MLRTDLKALAALFMGVMLLLLGNGLLNTLVTLAGESRGYSTALLGLLSSGYFIGFFIGIWLVVPVIKRVGHIRTFAVMAALAAIATLLHSLIDSPWLWLALRVVYGIALVSIYAVVESWLNGAVAAERRSKMFSIYTMISLGAVAAAQQLLRLDSPANLTLFVVAGILLIMALMPIAMTRLPQPSLVNMPDFNLKTAWQAAPVAMLASMFSGLLLGAFWGLMPLFGSMMGMAPAAIGLLMGAAIVGGAIGQLPIGYYSDAHDRRKVLVAVLAIGIVASVLLIPLSESWLLLAVIAGWGALAFSIYPVSVAYMIDLVAPEDILSGSSAVLLMFGLGAAIGPAAAGVLMGWFGHDALPVYFIGVLLLLGALLVVDLRRNAQRRVIVEPGHFTPMEQSAMPSLDMMQDTPEPMFEPQDKDASVDITSAETEQKVPTDADRQN